MVLYWHLQNAGVLTTPGLNLPNHLAFTSFKDSDPVTGWQTSSSLHEPFNFRVSNATGAASSATAFCDLSWCQSSASLLDVFMPSIPVLSGSLLNINKFRVNLRYSLRYTISSFYVLTMRRSILENFVSMLLLSCSQPFLKLQ